MIGIGTALLFATCTLCCLTQLGATCAHLVAAMNVPSANARRMARTHALTSFSAAVVMAAVMVAIVAGAL